MTYLTDVSSFDTGVYMLATTDPVQGGVGGVSNMPLQNLANRTRWLYDQLNAVLNGTTIPTGLAPLLSPAFTGAPTSPTPALGDNSTKIATTAFVQGTINGRLSLSVAGSSNVTLNAVQAGCGILTLTGALTANISVIVPAATGQWIVENNTTGAFTLTVKTAAGTGVAVTQGTQTSVFCDATNVQSTVTDFPSVALTGTPTAPTAAQFANTTQISTTAFVKRAQGSMNGHNSTTASAVLTAANVGNLYLFFGSATGQTITLPALSAVDDGSTIWICNDGSVPVTVSASGSDLIDAPVQAVAPSGTALVVLAPGDRAGFVSLTTSNGTWRLTNMTLANQFASPAFTGTPTAPTAVAGTNTTQLATTAFVLGQASSAIPVINGTASAGTVAAFSRADHVHPIDTTRAPLASPTFTGTPASVTPAQFDNTTKLATSAFVQRALGNMQAAAQITAATTLTAANAGTAYQFTGAYTVTLPLFSTMPTGGTLYFSNNTTGVATIQRNTSTDSINVGSTSLANVTLGSGDSLLLIAVGGIWLGFAGSVSTANSVAMTNKFAQLASPTFTGIPGAPTAAVGTNTTQLATTAYVIGQAATVAPVMNGTAAVGTSTLFARQDHVHASDTTRAPLASPTFTGSPSAPTPAQFDADTSIATTAFVQQSVGNNRGIIGVAAGATLTAATHAGAVVGCNATGTVTLPTIASMPNGSSITLMHNAGANGNVTIAAAGSDKIWVDSSSVASIAIGLNQVLTLTSDGSSGWYIAGQNLYGLTPAQFDSSTKLATSAYVQQALGNASGYYYFTASTTLTAVHYGCYFETATNAITITMPSATVRAGTRMTFWNNNANAVTFSTSGGFYGQFGAAAATVTIPAQASGVLESDGTNWCLNYLSGIGTTATQFDNSTKLATTAFVRNEILGLSNAIYTASLFPSVIGSGISNGYQKLPSGLILQWGSGVSNSSGVATLTLPIAFPNSLLMATCSYLLAGTALGVAAQMSSSSTKTALVANAFSTTGAAAVSNANVWFIAIGN